MKVLRREWFDVSRADEFRIIPLGDIHVGARGSDTAAFRHVVEDIASDERAYWIGMGDYLDAINRSDPRFSPGILADWFTVPMLDDIVGAQKEYFLDLIRPIAHKCLVMLKGNHEDVIRRHYERDIYLELVTAVREMGGFGQDYPMALGYYGWLQLVFFRSGQEERKRSTVFRIYLHHGFGGGRLKGGKALNMERVLLSRDADIVLMGHTHNRDVIMSSTERMAGRRPVVVERYGVYTGTFLRGTVDDVDTYSGVRGYLPLSIGCMEIRLRPGDENVRRRIRISTR